MERDELQHDPTRVIAVVGMAGRFPGAPDVASLWRLLMDGRDAIAAVPPDRWDATAQLDPEKAVPAFGGFLDDVDRFDPTFFGISPREAADIDPQQRLMLEASWSALEDGGQRAGALRGCRIGVYMGAAWHDYELVRKDRAAFATQHSEVGISLDVISARVSYFFKLTGPSLTVETGCSSGMVALHLAVQALRAGEVDGAIVGGVNLILAPDASIGLTHFGGLAPDGRCKAFAAGADGFGRSEGAIALYVKTLARAQADGDRVHGVIVHTVTNNDGGGESLASPNPAGQEDLLRRAYAESGVPVGRLAYLEAHGTGTPRGDPIEAGAIGRVIGRARPTAVGPLPIGSIKTNIGHLEAAAGLAGIVKVLLSLTNRVVPASLHFGVPNPEIAFDELNLRVVQEPMRLPATGPLYMGVNSFGWGGTNAHTIVASPPVESTGRDDTVPSLRPVFLPVSALNEGALRSRAADIGEVLRCRADPPVGVAGALAWRREHFPVRAAFVGQSADDLAAALKRFAADPLDESEGTINGRARGHGRTAFVFPGQGSQWAGMGRELYAGNDTFRAVIHRCAEALRPYVPWDLIGFLSSDSDDWLHRVDTIQPTLWAMTVALAELWREAGIHPDVVVGHSQGEVTAATVAGILSYADAALIMARRSALAQRAAGRGRMLAVDLDVAAARAALAGFEESVSLAVHNGPSSCVLSGDTDAVLVLKELLEADGIFCRLVNVDYASHCSHMAELRDDLVAALGSIQPRAGTVRLMSTVRLGMLSGPEMDPGYWADNLARPVLYADAMASLFDQGITHIVEISPHPLLLPATEQLAALREEPPATLATLRRDAGSEADLARAFARAYVSGLEPFGHLPAGACVALPAYPWRRERYWVAAGHRGASGRLDSRPALDPAVGQADVWQATRDLSTQEQLWLVDHKVHDAVLVPATVMMSFALSTGRARTGETPRTLVDVEFRDALALGEEPTRVATVWRDDAPDGGSFSLLSLSPGATTWTEHARAHVLQHAADHTPVAFPGRLLESHTYPPAEFYGACASRGLNYGPAFQGVHALRVDGDSALAHVILPDRCRASLRPDELHPALWDAALQATLSLVSGAETVVPTAAHRIHLIGSLDGRVTELWSHAVRRDAQRFDVYLFDAVRRPLMTIEGLTLHALPTANATEFDPEKVHRLVFGEAPPATSSLGEGSWLIYGDDTRVGRVADALRAAGATVSVVAGGGRSTGAVFAGSSPTDQRTSIVFLAPDRTAGLARQRQALATLSELVRVGMLQAVPPRLAVVTTDAQAGDPTDGADPGAALFWGFARVLRREHGELSPSIVDVSSSDVDWPKRLSTELLADDEEDQVLLRGERRLVGRLIRGGSGVESARARPPWQVPRQPFRLATGRPGLWEELAYRPVIRRAPAAGEIEIEVVASGLNFTDVMKAMGGYPDPRTSELLGGECAGRVAAVGPGVTGFQPGDRVVGCVLGAIASHVTLPAMHARPIPAGLDDVTAAALSHVTLTAWYGLHKLARLSAGETVLIHSAAGGLGLAAVGVAKALGATVVATAGTEAKRDYLRGLGIGHVFDSRDLSWAGAVRELTAGKGVDVVLNSLPGRAIPLGLDVLAEDGRFVEVGKKDIYGGRSIDLTAFTKGITFSSVDVAGLLERRPERFAQLLTETWKLITAGELAHPPVTTYRFAEAAEALRAMSRASHVGKVVLVDPTSVTAVTPEPMPAGRFRPDGGYLITGGLGALGLSLAEFLAEQGAGAVALLGRSAPDADALRRIAALRERRIQVRILPADVADPSALGSAIEDLGADFPPLRGVIHAAGILHDATILNITGEQLESVLRPKVDGALNLDAATAKYPLDFFVLFSSAAALFGNPGQAAYAAGNAFLDALALARRRRGLPGLSVQWGPFADIGLAATAGRGARLSRQGMGSFGAIEAWQALVGFLRQEEQVVGYVPINLRQWFDIHPDTAAQATWRELRDAARATGATAQLGGDVLAQLKACPANRRAEVVEAQVRQLAGRVLRLDPEAIERNTPLKALGLDSLMGLELRNRLEAAFGLRLAPTLLWTHGSPQELTGVLCERLFHPDTA